MREANYGPVTEIAQVLKCNNSKVLEAVENLKEICDQLEDEIIRVNKMIETKAWRSIDQV